jgi:2-polyprenyl-3-methyl-5-hydroxy-6-metoxy-1,4-benzoquinol methylase
MKCVLCYGIEFTEISDTDAKSRSALRVVFCEQCGLVQQSPVPAEEELKQYYSQDYRLDYKKIQVPKSCHVYRAGKTALHRIGFLKNNNIKSGRLLDIGAGGGEFVYLSGNSGFESEGIEPNRGYAGYSADKYKIAVKNGFLDDIQDSYDVITMFHVLEHLSSPVAAFEKI